MRNLETDLVSLLKVWAVFTTKVVISACCNRIRVADKAPSKCSTCSNAPFSTEFELKGEDYIAQVRRLVSEINAWKNTRA